MLSGAGQIGAMLVRRGPPLSVLEHMDASIVPAP